MNSAVECLIKTSNLLGGGGGGGGGGAVTSKRI